MNASTQFKRVVVAMKGVGYRIDIIGNKDKMMLFAYPPDTIGHPRNRWMALLYGKHKEMFYPQRKKEGSHIYSTIKNRISIDAMMQIVKGDKEFSFDE